MEVKDWVACLRGKTMSCRLEVACTRDGCDQKVSYADQHLLTKLLQGLMCGKFRDKFLKK